MHERIYNVIIKPHVSEKSMLLSERNNQVVLYALPTATKTELKKAVEELLNARVRSVKTSMVRGKVKSFKQRLGKRKSYKKAIICLEPGESIDLLNAE